MWLFVATLSHYLCPKFPLQIKFQLYAIYHIAPDKFVNVCKQTVFILAS